MPERVAHHQDFSGVAFLLLDCYGEGCILLTTRLESGERMSTPATPEQKTPSGSTPPSGPVTVFLKPCFGIAIQRNSLGVAVSVGPQPVDTGEPSAPRAVDESIACP
jgi:hypothetical protein